MLPDNTHVITYAFDAYDTISDNYPVRLQSRIEESLAYQKSLERIGIIFNKDQTVLIIFF